VALSVEHSSSDSSSSSEEDRSSDNDSDGPVRKKRDDVDDTLLISVREVVVSSVHVVEGSSLVHLEDSSVEVLAGSIELSAVSNISFSVSGVVSVGGEDLSSSEAVLLIEGGESNSGGGILEEDLRGIRVDPSIGDGISVVRSLNLNHVRSVSLISSFSSISGGVSVASGPLEVDVISNSSVQVLRDKVVLGGGVGLNNVSSLSSDVQVVESRSSSNSNRSLGDLEGE